MPHKARATLTGCCLLANCLLIVCFVDTATAMLTATSAATASATTTGCCCVGMRSTHALLPTSRRPTRSLLRFCLPQTVLCTPPLGLALKNICFMFAFCFQARCALASLALTLSPALSLSVCGSFLATRLHLTGCVSRACPKQQRQQWQQQQLSVPASTPARTERARLATCHETRSSSSSSSSISRRNAHTHTQRERERKYKQSNFHSRNLSKFN